MNDDAPGSMVQGMLAVGFGWLVCLSVAAAAAPGPEANVERIGRYQLEAGSQGLEVRRASSRRAAGWLAAGGALTLLLAGLAAARGQPAGVVAGAAAVLFAFAALAVSDRAVWHANSATLLHEGFGGRSSSWRTADIVAVEVLKRQPRGFDVKQPRPRLWEVRVRLRDTSSVGPSLRLDTRAEAALLAGRLAEALGKPLR